MGVKKNFAYSSILTASNYIFPLITYPYVSRVLGVSNIGICNFVDSIVHYFILFSMMGIAATGIREIASNKINQGKLNKTFTNLLCLNGLFTLLAAFIMVVMMYTIPKFIEYRDLLWIGVLKLIANSLLFEWFYKGLEDFKYITNRTLVVKCLYVVSVFVFVRNADDYDIFFLLMTLMIVVNAIINFIHCRKFVSIVKLNEINIQPYLKPFLIIGCYLILTSFYTSFNVAYLGFVSDSTEVGYYTTATKLFTIILAVFSAFTGVMLPRMSALRSEGKMKEFVTLINKSVSALIAFSVPAILLFTIFSPDIISLFAGKGYEGAILPARIVMPLIFVVGYEQILVLQILMPLKKDKAIFINSILGATFGIILNIAIVSQSKAIGSSIVWTLSELLILISSQYWVGKYLNISFPWHDLLKNVLVYIPAGVCCVFITLIDYNPAIRLFLAALFMLIFAIVIQVLYLKNEIITSMSNHFFKKIIR